MTIRCDRGANPALDQAATALAVARTARREPTGAIDSRVADAIRKLDIALARHRDVNEQWMGRAEREPDIRRVARAAQSNVRAATQELYEALGGLTR